ncbi:MAG: acyltransferase [Sediminibacterium sp.]|uniref:acyltransferase n=1 Tax=Sediminibacterium sp. TaxID=1917865 RepID=UPI002AB82C17|nr:acyltransferase [Sediminibacterium sp.]MDZ4070741.1 acyltransferase [Sediminibacterium sp.]
MIHPLADVQSQKIGNGTVVWQYSVILKDAVIGKNCNINCHTFIENNVVIGDNVTVKSGVYLWDGIVVHDNVFIGPNVTFTNDERPRSKQYPVEFKPIILERFSSIGAGSIILGGVIVGEYSMVGAGALVTKNVPSRALMKGSPAIVCGWLNDDGTKMKEINGTFLDNKGYKWNIIKDKLVKSDE